MFANVVAAATAAKCANWLVVEEGAGGLLLVVTAPTWVEEELLVTAADFGGATGRAEVPVVVVVDAYTSVGTTRSELICNIGGKNEGKHTRWKSIIHKIP